MEKVDHIAGTFGIGFTEIVSYLHQTVGGAAHGREYYDFGLAVFGDQSAHVLHAFGSAH